jgi:hypothetical protein
MACGLPQYFFLQDTEIVIISDQASGTGHLELLIEFSSDQHAADFLCPSTDSIQPGVSDNTTQWIVCI